jgi:hypothetical protein
MELISHRDDLRWRDRIRGHRLLIETWEGGKEVFIEDAQLFRDGPRRVFVIRSSMQANTAVLVGQEGSDLFKIDLEHLAASHMAELPRIDIEPDAGYHLLQTSERSGLILLHWELGILALDTSFQIRWRQDLDWNHEIIHIDDDEIWFDYFYDSEDGSQRIGTEPYGFAVATGRQLFDRRPPQGTMARKPLGWGGLAPP